MLLSPNALQQNKTVSYFKFIIGILFIGISISSLQAQSSKDFASLNTNSYLSKYTTNKLFTSVDSMMPTMVHTDFAENSGGYLPAGGCVAGTGNRFAGSWHSDLYIAANTSTGANDLYAWGAAMSKYTGVTASDANSGDVYTPRQVTTGYSGIPLEVRCGYPGGKDVFGLKTSTNFYIFGNAITSGTSGISGITSFSGFGGSSLSAGDVSAKLPSGVTVSDIAQFRISTNAIALITNSGNVYMMSKLTTGKLYGDNTASETTISGSYWHKVLLADGVTPLSGVTQFSLAVNGHLP